jgi:glutathione S-transferase
MKLYQYPLSPNCQKVLAVAREVGVPLETVTVNVFKGEAQTPDYTAKNPNGKVPLLEDGDLRLWESNAMLAYLAAKADRTDLAPTAPRERADVDRWLFWQTAHFGPAVRKVALERVVKKLASLGPPDEALVKQGTEEFEVVAKVLERSLEGRDYLCGRLTIADFALLPYAALTDSCGLGFDGYPKAKAWRGRMLARDSVQHSLEAARGVT